MSDTSTLRAQNSTKAPRYDAFISYSHAADARLAAALETLLEQLAKPWYRLRAANVFRDETSLTASPHLWPNISSNLQDSGFLILLASKTSADSKWVCRELCNWITGGICDDPDQLASEMLQPARVDRLLIVLTEGDIVWDDAAGGNGNFDWLKTTALPKLMSHVFLGEPLWVDLRWARANLDTKLDRSNKDFMKAVAKLSAPIRRLDIETLIGDDYRLQRRALVVFRGLSLGLTLALFLAIGLGGWAFYSRLQAKESEAQAKESRDWALDEAKRKSQRTSELYTERGNSAAVQLNQVEALHHFAQAIKEQESEILDPTQRRLADEAESMRVFSSAGGFYGTRAEAKEHRGAKTPDSSGRFRFGQLEPSYYLSKIVEASSLNMSPIDIRLNDSGGGGYFFQTHPRLVRRLNEISGAEAAWSRMQRSEGVWKLGNGTNTLETISYKDLSLSLRADDVLVSRFPSLKKGAEAEVDKVDEKSADEDRDSAAEKLLENWTTERLADVAIPHRSATAAISVDGSKVVTAGYDGTAVVWDTTDGSELTRLVGHKKGIYWADFDSTGLRVVTAGADGSARIWDLSVTPPHETQLTGHLDKVRCAEFSNDGKFVVTASDDGSVRIWSTKDGKQYRSFPSDIRNAIFAGVSDDGRKVMAVTSRSTKVWDLEEQRLLAELGPHEDRLFSACVSANFDTIETRSWDHEIRIWRERETANSNAIVIPEGGTEERQVPGDFFVGSDTGKRIVTYQDEVGVRNGSLKVWNISNGLKDMKLEFSLAKEQLPSGLQGEPIVGITVGTTCDRIVIQLSHQFVVLRRDGELWKRESILPGRALDWDCHPSLTRDEKWFVFPEGSNLVAVPLNSTENGIAPTSVFSNTAAVSGTMLEQFALNDDSSQLAYVLWEADDRRRIYLSKLDPNTLVPTTAEPIVFRSGDHRYNVTSCTFHGTQLLTSSWDRTAKLWDASSPDVAPIVFSHSEPVDDAAFSPNGKWVATGAWDKKARLWDVEDQNLVAEFVHPGRVLKVAFFSNKTDLWLLTSCSDGRARLWPLTAIEGDAKHLVLWTELLTGTEMRASDLRALDSDVWKQKLLESIPFVNLMPQLPSLDKFSR